MTERLPRARERPHCLRENRTSGAFMVRKKTPALGFGWGAKGRGVHQGTSPGLDGVGGISWPEPRAGGKN